MAAVLEDARSKDLKRLYEIEKECFDEEAFTSEQISQLLDDYNTVSLVARVEGKIVGFVIGIIYVDKKALYGHVLTVDVAPSYRRRGFGRLLMNEIEKIFAMKSVEALYLEVREDNAPAIRLYLQLGYRVIGKLDHYYGKAHGICLKKTLT